MVDARAPRRAGRPSPDPRWGGGWTDDAQAGYAEPGADLRGAGMRAAGRRERGAPAWLALLILLVIASIGGAVDVMSGSAVRGGFNVALVVAAIVAIVVVRRRGMFPIVIAPPLVYAVASAIVLYARSGGGNNRKVLLDAAVNWLVYGFPAMAIATGAVLVIAVIRLLAGRR